MKIGRKTHSQSIYLHRSHSLLQMIAIEIVELFNELYTNASGEEIVTNFFTIFFVFDWICFFLLSLICIFSTSHSQFLLYSMECTWKIKLNALKWNKVDNNRSYLNRWSGSSKWTVAMTNRPHLWAWKKVNFEFFVTKLSGKYWIHFCKWRHWILFAVLVIAATSLTTIDSHTIKARLCNVHRICHVNWCMHQFYELAASLQDQLSDNSGT